MHRVWVPLCGLAWEKDAGIDIDRWNGAELRRRREEACLTTSELAVKVGTEGATVSSWERVCSRPSPIMVLVLSTVLGCAPRAFFHPEK